MHHWSRSSLAQVMACCLFCTKPLPEPMMTWFNGPSGTKCSNIWIKIQKERIKSGQCIWECHLQNSSHFIQCANGYILICINHWWSTLVTWGPFHECFFFSLLFKFKEIVFLLRFHSYQFGHYKFLHMLRQHSCCVMCAVLPPSLFNSLWPSDAKWWQRSGSTLAQVMDCCLKAPSHYLTQCWLNIRKVQWHLGNFTTHTSAITH